MTERCLMHPYDFSAFEKALEKDNRAFASIGECLAAPLLEIVPDRFGVLPRGHFLLMSEPVRVELPRSAQIPVAGPRSDSSLAFEYAARFALPPPRSYAFIGIDLAADTRTPREMWRAAKRLSAKLRARAQRRLDRASNVRRRKRRAELKRRRTRKGKTE